MGNNINLNMGNCNLKSEEEGANVSPLSKSQFEYKYAIGRGGFGKVWRVTNRLKGDKTPEYAMKEMLKARVMHKKSI